MHKLCSKLPKPYTEYISTSELKHDKQKFQSKLILSQNVYIFHYYIPMKV